MIVSFYSVRPRQVITDPEITDQMGVAFWDPATAPSCHEEAESPWSSRAQQPRGARPPCHSCTGSPTARRRLPCQVRPTLLLPAAPVGRRAAPEFTGSPCCSSSGTSLCKASIGVPPEDLEQLLHLKIIRAVRALFGTQESRRNYHFPKNSADMFCDEVTGGTGSCPFNRPLPPLVAVDRSPETLLAAWLVRRRL
jgi:hypothetical protein